MLYLLDANILITANNSYYPLERIPEFWEWLHHQAKSGHVKIPLENMEEIQEGRDDDPLIKWVSNTEEDFLLRESVNDSLVRRVISEGYAPDLTEVEIEKLGRDPFLIAYGLADLANRCVITTEVSRPSAQRQNKKIPDVCKGFSINCFGPFYLNQTLGFRTSWNQ